MGSVADKYRAQLNGNAMPATAPKTGSVAEKYRNQLTALQRQPAPEAPPQKPEMSLGGKLLGGVNAVGQGMSLNLADEAGSALAAGAVKVGDFFTGNENSEDFTDIYSSMMGGAKRDRNEFSEEMPLTSMGLEIAGGFATGGVGASKVLGLKGLQTASRLKKAIAAADGGVAGATQAIKGASKLKRAMAVIGAGAAEGGIAGFGSGDTLEERAKGAGFGASLGAGFSAVPQLAKAGMDVATARKVAQSLDVGDDFIPLNVADSGPIGNFYRDIIGGSFGGRQKLIDQTSPHIAKAMNRSARAAQKLDSAKNNHAYTVNRAKTQVNNRFAGETSNAQRLKDGAIAQADLAASESVTQAGAKASSGLAQARAAMNAKLVNNAIPDSIPPKIAKAIRNASPDEANELVKSAWKKHGFKSLVGKKYALNAEQVKAQFKKTIGKDPAMLEASGGINSMVDDIFELHGTKTGSISGKAIMQLRNSMRAKKGAEGMASLVPTAYGKMADDLDAILRKGMDPTEIKALDNDLAKWAGKVSLNKAVKNARGKRQGIPNETDVISAARYSKGGNYGKGKGSAQQEAEAVQLLTESNKVDLATATSNANAGLTKAKAAAADAFTNTQNGIKARNSILSKGQERVGSLKVAEAARVAKRKAGKESRLRGLAPNDNVSTFEQLFKTGLVGAGYGLGNLVSGTLTSRKLASPTAQRFIAGQTKGQETLAKMLRKYGGSIDALSVGAGGAAGTQSDEF